MVKYHTILFDLDGTLTDPKEGIVNSVKYALQKLNIEEKNEKSLEQFIGPPLKVSFESFYGLNSEEATKAVQNYREYFSKKGILENKLYPGIKELLSNLKEVNLRLFLATSKPTIYAEQILEHFNIITRFDSIIGSNLDLTRTSKGEIIQYILQNFQCGSLDEIAMIGDTKFDIIGAQENRIASVGVTYGYGNTNELIATNPEYVVNSVSELNFLLLN